MHKINVEYNERLNLLVLTCPEGCKITSWNEGDNIENYFSFSVAYCPANTDTSIYHCISIEEDERLNEELRKLIESERERR